MDTVQSTATVSVSVSEALALVQLDKAPVTVIAEEYGLLGKKPSEVRAFFRQGFFPGYTGKTLTEAVGAICGSYQRQAGLHAIRETVKAFRAGEMLSVEYSKTGLLAVSAHRFAPKVNDPLESAFRRVKAIADKSEADKERLLDLVGTL